MGIHADAPKAPHAEDGHQLHAEPDARVEEHLPGHGQEDLGLGHAQDAAAAAKGVDHELDNGPEGIFDEKEHGKP